MRVAKLQAQLLSRGGISEDEFLLCFEVVAANIRLVPQWAKRNEFTADPLCIPMPQSHGFEELDARGQVSLTETSFFDDPPDELVALATLTPTFTSNGMSHVI